MLFECFGDFRIGNLQSLHRILINMAHLDLQVLPNQSVITDMLANKMMASFRIRSIYLQKFLLYTPSSVGAPSRQ
jgi:hypothetical protein